MALQWTKYSSDSENSKASVDFVSPLEAAFFPFPFNFPQ